MEAARPTRFDALLEADHRHLDLIYREAVDALCSGDAAAALGRVDVFWARLAVHIRAEHLRLFPAVPRNEALVARLRRDHEDFMTSLADAMKLLRRPNTSSSVADARKIVLRLGESLAEHNRLEEETVYREAGAQLSDAQLAELTGAIEKELHNLPPRFAAESD